MATVSEIWVRVNADVKGLQSGLLKGGTELKAFSATANKSAAESTAAGSKIGGAFSGVSSTLNRLAPAFIAIGAVAVGAIVKGISATTQWASEVRSLQRVTGQTAESASALAGAAAQLGIPVSQLTTGFGLLAKNIVNGSAGLTKYGIATRDASGQILPFDDVLLAISDKFNSLPTAMDKAAFAQNVFGKSGKNLIPILSQGAAGLKKLEENARAAGLVMSQQDLDAAKNLTIAQHQLGEAFKGASISIGKAFVPAATVLVHVITGVVEVVAAIPQPIKLAVLGFSVLTGAVAATAKIGGFFADTWKKVLGVAGNTAQLSSAAQGATDVADALSQVSQELANFANIATAVRGSTIAATAPIAVMAVETNTQADAALAASLANTKFARSVSGLIVPTDALGVSAATTADEITATGGGLAGLSGIAVPVAAALGLVAAGFVVIRKDMAAAHAEFQAGLNADLSSLVSGGGLAARIRQLAQQPLPGQHLTVGAGRVLQIEGDLSAQKASIEEAQAALAAFRQGQILATGSTKDLASSFRGLLKGVTDFTTPVKDVPILLGALSTAAVRATGGLDHLSQVSGQDFSSIRDDLLKAINDPKTTVAQLPAIFGAALDKVKTETKAWHDSIVQNFGGASAALSDFLGQAAGKGPKKVSFDNLTASLTKTQGQLHRWSQDFSTILAGSGDKANKFLQDMSANGLQSIGILDVVAQQPKKIRDQFLTQYNQVNKSTNTVATQITDAFGKGIDKVVGAIDRIYNAIAKILGLPPIKLKADTSDATSKIHALVVALRGVKDKDVSVRFHQVGSVQHPLPFHAGGLVMHAGGLIDWQHMTHTPQFHAGGTVSWAHDSKPTKLPELTQTVRRMHTGGLGADEVPIIAQRGEFVVRKSAVVKPGVLPLLRAVNRMHDGGNVVPAVKHVIERLTSERFHEGGAIERLRSIERSHPKVIERFHEGGSIERLRSSERLAIRQVTDRFHDGGLIREVIHAAAPSIAARVTHIGGSTYHTGGTVELVGTSASSQLLRESRFHTGGLTERFRTVERFHDGGMTVVQPPTTQAPSEGIEEALRRAIRAEMAEAVTKGVREVREKLYVDRRRFGRDLDQNVLTDGHW